MPDFRLSGHSDSFRFLSGFMIEDFRVLAILIVCSMLTPSGLRADDPGRNRSGSVRIATFNVALYGSAAGELRDRLATGNDPQVRNIARIVQTVRPDILLVCELDYEPDGAPARLLAENYFAIAQPSQRDGGSLEPIRFQHRHSIVSNTGIDSGLDTNRDGQRGTADDAWGYGRYPGQYAMTLFSRYPIDFESIRSFQKLLWSAMPGASRPVDPASGMPFHPDAVWSKLRLSSKNHVDIPVRLGDRVVHVLASHPTPPVFDGPEDRNGNRNHDEIVFWKHYIDGEADADGTWIVDDQGRPGTLADDAEFVVMGDLNADPLGGGGRREGIASLIAHPRVQDVVPTASAPAGAAGRPASPNRHTADFGRNGPMRVDYVLPSKGLSVRGSGVFWPTPPDPRAAWVKASDHRLVWIDIEN